MTGKKDTSSGNGKGARRYPTVTIVLDDNLMDIVHRLIDKHAEEHPELSQRVYRISPYFRHLIAEEARREGILE